MKAIILAAGEGTRLKKYTKYLPKGMLNFDGKSLIERQNETLSSSNIEENVKVKGFEDQEINFSEVKYYINRDYANTNMVASLFCAEKELKSEILVCYADILYEKRIVKKILESKLDIGVTADKSYLGYWKARLDKPEDDLESFVVKNGRLIEIGVPNCSLDKAKMRYVGLIKFSKRGIEALKKVFYENKQRYWNKNERWLNSKSFNRAYMTDMLQSLINRGYEVKPIIINRGWMEFDTVEDYEKANKWLEDGSLSKFYSLNN